MTSAVLTMLYLIRRRYDGSARRRATSRARWARSAASCPRPRRSTRPPTGSSRSRSRSTRSAIICGAIWAEAAWGRYWGWDPKETWAFIAWVIYAATCTRGRPPGWKGRAAAWINLLGFGAMTFNFFVVNIVVSGLHSYAGLN